ncbi:hypothetical protein [Candidatus Hodgkinia cicadicola]|uniref:hypothetical protein n=1 Tax=Candidatus Hodgkinia cicadicola TaxID=573658 RepID=UPI0011BA561B
MESDDVYTSFDIERFGDSTEGLTWREEVIIMAVNKVTTLEHVTKIMNTSCVVVVMMSKWSNDRVTMVGLNKYRNDEDKLTCTFDVDRI